MKKERILSLLLIALFICALLAGCRSENGETTDNAVSDQEAADEAAALIDAIYVQERTENTDEQCAAAKAAWDALTDAQKALVSGKNADPDYFGRDTGDASKDYPLNGDDIGENELLVVSFGTSFNDSRVADIGGIEKALQEAYPDWSVRRAFTAQIIINHIQARDGEKIDNMDQALERAVANGVKNLVIQPTHLMHGAEYDELMAAVEEYLDMFESVKISEPLLGEVGSDATSVNEDKETVAIAITAEAVSTAGYDSLDAAAADGVAFVFMGHGTSHTANVTYDQMQTQMVSLGYENVFIGTVEGEPADTACDVVIEAVKAAGYTKVILRPMMVVAGDHANNDMAGDDEDSWKSQFVDSGYFDSVDTQIAGLGEIGDIQAIYMKHVQNAIDGTGVVIGEEETQASVPEGPIGGGMLRDGTYEISVASSSSMFNVVAAELMVADGKMTAVITLSGDGYEKLYVGTGEEALADTDDQCIYFVEDAEGMYTYAVPVEALDQETNVAAWSIKKQEWYDRVLVFESGMLPAEAFK